MLFEKDDGIEIREKYIQAINFKIGGEYKKSFEIFSQIINYKDSMNYIEELLVLLDKSNNN